MRSQIAIPGGSEMCMSDAEVDTEDELEDRFSNLFIEFLERLNDLEREVANLLVVQSAVVERLGIEDEFEIEIE